MTSIRSAAFAPTMTLPSPAVAPLATPLSGLAVTVTIGITRLVVDSCNSEALFRYIQDFLSFSDYQADAIMLA
jgi:hypothetical protein